MIVGDRFPELDRLLPNVREGFVLFSEIKSGVPTPIGMELL